MLHLFPADMLQKKHLTLCEGKKYNLSYTKMPISDKYKVIFVHIPKTAGTSVAKTLALRRDPRGNTPWEEWHFTGSISKEEQSKYGLGHHARWGHLFASEIKTFVPDNIFRGYYKFAFVRNPWDRAVSCFSGHAAKNKDSENNNSFEKWILSHEFLEKKAFSVKLLKPQVNYILDEKGQCLVDFIGRYENIEKDWKKICAKTGIKAALPHINKSGHRHYSLYYNRRTRQIVADAFKKDIEMFGYRFEDRRIRYIFKRVLNRVRVRGKIRPARIR
jgi:hypothetical protein